VGALAHYLEQNGIPTTQISLIYEHTDTIRPPRALWVPFELGRPLGVPGGADFQKKVLKSALALLEAENGPVLEVFEEEAPTPADEKSSEGDTWACPVNISSPAEKESDQKKRISAFKQEINELRPWYDMGKEKRDRTTLTHFEPETAAQVLCNYLVGEKVEAPNEDMSLSVLLRLAAQDLKAFYFEAAISKPGTTVPDSQSFTNWYWNRTAAGGILKELKEKLTKEDDKDLQMTGQMFLVPMRR